MQRGIDWLREPQKAGLPALAAHTHYAFTDTRWPRLAGVLLSVATLFVGLFIRWVRTGAVWP